MRALIIVLGLGVVLAGGVGMAIGQVKRSEGDELKDAIYIKVEGKQVGTLPAQRVHLPDADFTRGDARLGVTLAGHIYVALWKNLHWSTDEGRTWSTRDLPVQSGGFGVLGDDTLVVFTGHPKPSTIRSTDYGKTWSKPTPVDISPYDTGGGGWGHVMQLTGGPALMTVQCCYEQDAKDPKSGKPRQKEQLGIYDHVYRSTDSGKTWGDRSLICRDSAETSLLLLKSGKMMAATRRQRHPQQTLPTDNVDELKAQGMWDDQHNQAYIRHAYFANSDDLGRTWKNLRLAPCYRLESGMAEQLCPSELLQLPDGRVVWIHHRRHRPLKGIYARVSHDEGQTWTKRRYWLRDLREQDHGLYPASTVLKDGTLLTVTSTNHSNRSMAIRWRLPAGE